MAEATAAAAAAAAAVQEQFPPPPLPPRDLAEPEALQDAAEAAAAGHGEAHALASVGGEGDIQEVVIVDQPHPQEELPEQQPHIEQQQQPHPQQQLHPEHQPQAEQHQPHTQQQLHPEHQPQIEGQQPQIEGHQPHTQQQLHPEHQPQAEQHQPHPQQQLHQLPLGLSLEQSVSEMHAQQSEQARLIATMQSTIDGLSARQSELEEEIRGLKGGRWVVRAESSGGATSPGKRSGGKGKGTPRGHALPSTSHPSAADIIEGSETTDDDVMAIIDSRHEKNGWPLKRKYCSAFSQEVDLLRLRFHRSDAFPHKSVRIPKVDKSEGYGLGNKEGRLICRLCSGRTINRNTSWMCDTCSVPLCVDVVNGDPESSCHARWHSCHDLVETNNRLNAELRERRESKKRSRESMEEDRHREGAMRTEEDKHGARPRVENSQAEIQAAHVQLQAGVVVPLQATEQEAALVEPMKVELQAAEEYHQQQPQDRMVPDPRLDSAGDVLLV